MSDRYYPDIAGLVVVRKLMKDDPEYLDDPDCPFDDEIKAFLRGQTVSTLVTLETIDAETQRVYAELQEYGKDLAATDAAEKNTYFRLSAALLEKLISLMERSVNVKAVKRFQEAVIATMEDELNPDQRSRVIEALRKSAAGE